MDQDAHVSSRLRPRHANTHPSLPSSGGLGRSQSTLTGNQQRSGAWAVPRAKAAATARINGLKDVKDRPNKTPVTASEGERPKKRSRTAAPKDASDSPGKTQTKTAKKAKPSTAESPAEPLPFLTEDEILLRTTTQIPPLTFDLDEAKRHLIAADARFGPLLDGFKFRVFEEVAPDHGEGGDGDAPHEVKGKELNLFKTLVSSVVGQQVSWMAARSILYKFVRLWFEELPVVPDFNALPRDALPFPTPSQVCAATEERLRSAGLSGAKARYVRDIATRFCDGRLDVRRIVGLCQSETVADTEGKGEERPEGNEAEVIKELVQIKGVGTWTAEMILIFALRRCNVLPLGDLGVQRGVVLLWASGPEGPNVKKGKVAVKSKEEKEQGSGSTASTVTPVPADNSPARKTASEAFKVEEAVEEAERDVVVPAEQVAQLESKSSPADATPIEGVQPKAPPPIPASAKLTPAQLTARKNGQKVKGGMYLTPEEMTALCASWAPYRSLASIVMWSLVS